MYSFAKNSNLNRIGLMYGWKTYFGFFKTSGRSTTLNLKFYICLQQYFRHLDVYINSLIVSNYSNFKRRMSIRLKRLSFTYKLKHYYGKRCIKTKWKPSFLWKMYMLRFVKKTYIFPSQYLWRRFFNIRKIPTGFKLYQAKLFKPKRSAIGVYKPKNYIYWYKIKLLSTVSVQNLLFSKTKFISYNIPFFISNNSFDSFMFNSRQNYFSCSFNKNLENISAWESKHSTIFLFKWRFHKPTIFTKIKTMTFVGGPHFVARKNHIQYILRLIQSQIRSWTRKQPNYVYNFSPKVTIFSFIKRTKLKRSTTQPDFYNETRPQRYLTRKFVIKFKKWKWKKSRFLYNPKHRKYIRIKKKLPPSPFLVNIADTDANMQHNTTKNKYTNEAYFAFFC